MKTRILGWLLLSFLGTSMFAQSPDHNKYWVFFSDKSDLEFYQPGDFLSTKALERRQKQGIALDEKDIPVRQDYIDAVGQMGAELRHPSKWFNAVSAVMDQATVDRVAALPFVRDVRPIKIALKDLDAVNEATKIGYTTGFTASQLEQIGLDQLHQNGYNGRGITIAVMDNGFQQANENPSLRHLFDDNRIVATYDFVNNESNVFNQGWHGQAVLSILAGWHEVGNDSLNFYGSAHGASYILCHTENDASETTQEEDNWVAAMEFADSAGADIFTTSLGYSGMDDPATSYTYADMDGNTTIITRGADIAASRGIVVVNSAGNSGNNKITAPADGDSVIAVGAVDLDAEIAGFSSRGPAADGDLKPDVVAMGVQTGYLQASGGLSRGNGTSFSCPMLSGMLACVLQAAPETGNMELYDALIRASDRYSNPDTIYGYGLPDASRLVERLTGRPLDAAFANEDLEHSGLGIFPNPAMDFVNVVIDNEETGYQGDLQIIDEAGRLVFQQDITIHPFYNVIHLSRENELRNLRAGRYIVRILGGNGDAELRYSGKIVLTR